METVFFEEMVDEGVRVLRECGDVYTNDRDMVLAIYFAMRNAYEIHVLPASETLQ